MRRFFCGKQGGTPWIPFDLVLFLRSVRKPYFVLYVSDPVSYGTVLLQGSQAAIFCIFRARRVLGVQISPARACLPLSGAELANVAAVHVAVGVVP